MMIKRKGRGWDEETEKLIQRARQQLRTGDGILGSMLVADLLARQELAYVSCDDELYLLIAELLDYDDDNYTAWAEQYDNDPQRALERELDEMDCCLVFAPGRAHAG